MGDNQVGLEPLRAYVLVEIAVMTAPTIEVDVGHDSGIHKVVVNVTGHGKQICFGLNEDGWVASSE